MDDPRPLHEQPAPPVIGSPSQMRPRSEIRWYLPTWGERFRFMGWRIIYFVPLVLLVAILIVSIIDWHYSFIGVQLLVWWKLWVIAIVIPTTAAIKAAREAIRARPDPFCIHCGYSLTGLPDHHFCPECGEQFDLAVVSEYRRDPHAFIDRYKKLGAIPHAEHVAFDAGVNQVASRDGT